MQSQAWRSQTEDFLDHWVMEKKADAGFVVDKDEWLITLAGADNALNNMPGSPDLQVIRAKVLDWGVRSGWSTNDSGEPLELDAWQQATLLRPAWPYSWSSYAQARSQRSLIDPQLEQALVRADQLGHYRPLYSHPGYLRPDPRHSTRQRRRDPDHRCPDGPGATGMCSGI